MCLHEKPRAIYKSAILERICLQNDLRFIVEFWLRWNYDFCYPSHARSLLLLPRTPPKITQNLFKQKKTLQPDPPKILNFQPQGASGWQHEPKRLPKGFLLGGSGSPRNNFKRDRNCGRDPTPQNGPSFSPNGCQNELPKRFKLAQILSKEVFETSWQKQTRGSNKYKWWLGDGAKSQEDLIIWLVG